MPISQDDPRWTALATALVELVRDTGATNAVVADSSENLWCRAREMNTAGTIGIDELWDLAIASASPKTLSKGGRVDLLRTKEEPYMIAVSFANMYLLILWFAAPFTGDHIRRVVGRHLPVIEELTVGLPPDDDPLQPAISARSSR